MTSAFLQAYAVAGFVFVTWVGGECARRLSAPALVGEIVAGLILGPSGLDAVPFDEAFASVGRVGLALLVLEGGLHVKLETLKRVWRVSFLVALTGTCLPLVSAWGLLSALPRFRSREGLLCGTALSSTAIGMAAQLMQDLGVADTRLGQVVVTSAMFDDVLSLILLAMVSEGLDHGAFRLALPLLSSAVFVVARRGPRTSRGDRRCSDPSRVFGLAFAQPSSLAESPQSGCLLSYALLRSERRTRETVLASSVASLPTSAMVSRFDETGPRRLATGPSRTRPLATERPL